MKIGIQTWGSYGDIRPFLALAEGLQSAGHKVTLAITCVDSSLDDLLASQDKFAIQSVSSPVIKDREVLMNIEGQIFNESDPLKQTQIIIEKLFQPAELSMYETASQLCAQNDLVIGHFFHYPLNIAAELSGCPYVSVALVHSAVPSALLPPSGIPNLGKLGNRLAWRLVKSLLNKKLKKYSDRLRAAHGMQPARDLVEDVWASKQLTLLAVSPQICEGKADWPDYYQVCGFLNKENQQENATVSETLQEFLIQGDAPVYMTFGSVIGGDRKNTISLLLAAAEKASVRVIIQAPHCTEYGFTNSNDVYFVDSSPHGKVFPQCSAVVHHGGAGTSQSVLLAGKPSVVVAHTSEQAFWAKELLRLNVSSKPLSRRKLTADGLAREMRAVIDSSKATDNAKKIAMAMGNDNGVATAVKLINEKFTT